MFARTQWSQAELARKLELTPGGVSGIVKGPTNPSASLLKLLQLVVALEKPELLGEFSATFGEGIPAYGRPRQSDEEVYGRLITRLESLDPATKEKVAGYFAGLVELIPPANSSADAAAQRELEGVAGLAQKAWKQFAPASKPGSTSGVSYGKKRSSRARPGAKESGPDPHPK